MIDDPDVTILAGDARERLADLDAASAQTIVTSPPFWGLRDYGTGSWAGGDPDCPHTWSVGGTKNSTLARPANWLSEEQIAKKVEGYGHASYRSVCGKCGATRVDLQIGLEETVDAWADSLVDVLAAARRVLRPDGTLWLEVGDKYVGKSLVGAPWILASALRRDGWLVRAENIWHRPNPMPESVDDRTTKAHSTVFLFAPNRSYFYDADAIREPVQDESAARYARASRYDDTLIADAVPYRATRPRGTLEGEELLGANARSVWTIPSESTPFEHFATMPTALARKCILAGSREGDLVLDPFMGSGTTALVARSLGRRSAGVELSPEFLAIARERLGQQSLFA